MNYYENITSRLIDIHAIIYLEKKCSQNVEKYFGCIKIFMYAFMQEYILVLTIRWDLI